MCLSTIMIAASYFAHHAHCGQPGSQCVCDEKHWPSEVQFGAKWHICTKWLPRSTVLVTHERSTHAYCTWSVRAVMYSNVDFACFHCTQIAWDAANPHLSSSHTGSKRIMGCHCACFHNTRITLSGRWSGGVRSFVFQSEISTVVQDAITSADGHSAFLGNIISDVMETLVSGISVMETYMPWNLLHTIWMYQEIR